MSEIFLQSSGEEYNDFIYQLFRTLKVEELNALDWPRQFFDLILPMQFKAHESHYRNNFPDAGDFIILKDSIPVGRIIIDKSGSFIHLIEICVLPEFRGQGIGTTVITKLLKEGEILGKSVRLQVAHNNRAIKLYEQLGFSDINCTKTHHQMEWKP